MAGAIKKTPVGTLRHRCRVEKLAPTPSRDGFGAEVPAWLSQGVVWCRVEPQVAQSGERMIGSHQQADCTHSVTMRFRADLTPKKRLVWLRGGAESALNVVFVMPMEGNENWVVAWCKTEQ